MLLATTSTITFLNGWFRRGPAYLTGYYLNLVLLSLTHYFGLIYAGIIIIITLYRSRYNAARALTATVVGMLCLMWPAIHFLYGGPGNSIGNYWLVSEGLQSTVYQFSSAITPQINYLTDKISERAAEYLTAISVLILFVTIIYLSRHEVSTTKTNSDAEKKWLDCSLLLGSFLFVLILIDYYSPISKNRYYIVLLPAVSILVGFAAKGLNNLRECNVYVSLLIFAVGVGNLTVAWIRVADKISPMENHRGAVQYIESRISPQTKVYYVKKHSPFPEIEALMARFYFRSEIDLIPIAIEEISSLHKPYYVLLQHQKYNVKKVIEGWKNAGTYVKSYTPQKNNRVLVLYSE